jgi:murein L,D-transpeptidase YafK
VQAGRVFKEKESLTVWVSDDANKIPLLVKADLAVGSLKATLSEFRGLQHSFKVLAE